MALTAKGFTGTVGQVDFARIDGAGIVEGLVGSAPGASTLRVDRVVGQDRTVTVQTGSAKAPGARATNDAVATYVLPANAAGQPRLDWLVLRFDWQTDPGTVVLTHVQGTAAANPQRPTLTRNAGVRWELPLALVRVDAGVGSFPADAVQDARYWCGHGCVVQAARTVDPPPDAGRLLYIVNDAELLASNGSEYGPVAPTLNTGSLSLATGWTAYGGGFASPSYWLQDGRVELAGLIRRTGASLAMDATHTTTVFTLPAAIRPPTLRAIAALSKVGPVRLTLGPSGGVTTQKEDEPATLVKDVGWISLDGLTYRVF